MKIAVALVIMLVAVVCGWVELNQEKP